MWYNNLRYGLKPHFSRSPPRESVGILKQSNFSISCTFVQWEVSKWQNAACAEKESSSDTTFLTPTAKPTVPGSPTSAASRLLLKEPTRPSTYALVASAPARLKELEFFMLIKKRLTALFYSRKFSFPSLFSRKIEKAMPARGGVQIIPKTPKSRKAA